MVGLLRSGKIRDGKNGWVFRLEEKLDFVF
jgi:hypothetical protein